MIGTLGLIAGVIGMGLLSRINFNLGNYRNFLFVFSGLLNALSGKKESCEPLIEVPPQ